MKNICYFISENGNLVNIEKGSSVSTDINNCILNYVYNFYNEKNEANPTFTTSTSKRKIDYQIIESYNGQFNSLKRPCYIYLIHNNTGLINKGFLSRDAQPLMRQKVDNLLEFLLHNKHIVLLGSEKKLEKTKIKIKNKTLSSTLHYNLINLRSKIYEVFDDERRDEIKENIGYVKQKIKKKIFDEKNWD